MKTNIISVKYEDNYMPKTFSGKAYHYYNVIKDLKIGDLVIAPTNYGAKIAIVRQLDIPENEVQNFKNQLKTIITKINKTEYLQNNKKIKEVA